MAHEPCCPPEARDCNRTGIPSTIGIRIPAVRRPLSDGTSRGCMPLALPIASHIADTPWFPRVPLPRSPRPALAAPAPPPPLPESATAAPPLAPAPPRRTDSICSAAASPVSRAFPPPPLLRRKHPHTAERIHQCQPLEGSDSPIGSKEKR